MPLIDNCDASPLARFPHPSWEVGALPKHQPHPIPRFVLPSQRRPHPSVRLILSFEPQVHPSFASATWGARQLATAAAVP
eukprot:9480177-Pyramimonas_sp.AAC.1